MRRATQPSCTALHNRPHQPSGRGLSTVWPHNAGSYPGIVFTGPPLNLASGHFGLGYGTGAHAPDEYYLIESSNPKVQGYDGAVMSFVDYLYELGK